MSEISRSILYDEASRCVLCKRWSELRDPASRRFFLSEGSNLHLARLETSFGMKPPFLAYPPVRYHLYIFEDIVSVHIFLNLSSGKIPVWPQAWFWSLDYLPYDLLGSLSSFRIWLEDILESLSPFCFFVCLLMLSLLPLTVVTLLSSGCHLAMGCYPGPIPVNWAGSGCRSTGQRTGCTNSRPAAHRRVG